MPPRKRFGDGSRHEHARSDGLGPGERGRGGARKRQVLTIELLHARTERTIDWVCLCALSSLLRRRIERVTGSSSERLLQRGGGG
jgi:hypothetical protein